MLAIISSSLLSLILGIIIGFLIPRKKIELVNKTPISPSDVIDIPKKLTTEEILIHMNTNFGLALGICQALEEECKAILNWGTNDWKNTYKLSTKDDKRTLGQLKNLMYKHFNPKNEFRTLFDSIVSMRNDIAHNLFSKKMVSSINEEVMKSAYKFTMELRLDAYYLLEILHIVGQNLYCYGGPKYVDAQVGLEIEKLLNKYPRLKRM